jgi:ABC-type transporter Mla subunit MlaD
MTDDVFRIIIAVAVGLACIMFVVQALVLFGLLRTVRKLEQRLQPLTRRAELLFENLGLATGRLGPMVEDATGIIAKLGPVIEKIGPAFDKIAPFLDKLETTTEQAGRLFNTTRRTIDEVRPRISEVSNEVVAISHSGRVQVERIGEILHEAGERARQRLEQIDSTVESTVEQVELVGDAVKRTVMRPVREVNGIAAGVSAAIATLVNKPRKSSVDSATQDEEMFI